MADKEISEPLAVATGLPAFPATPPGAPGATSPVWVVARRPPSKEAAGVLTPQFVLRAILHWFWPMAIAALLLAAVSSAAIFYFGKPVYRASAWIEIEPRTRYLVRDGRDESDKPEQDNTSTLRWS